MAQASPALPAGITLTGSAARRRRERLVRAVFLGAALTTVVISFFIIETVLVEAISFLQQIDLSQLFGIGWFPRRGIFDVTTLIIGTLIVTVIAMVIATPIGLASAIYLSEYATPSCPQDGEAGHRGARGHPQRGPRVLRADGHHAQPSPAAVRRRERVQPRVGRDRRRHPVGSTGRLGGGGCNARGAHEPSRGLVRPRREEDHHVAAGRVPGRGLGHRGGADPRHQPHHRRDDGRRRGGGRTAGTHRQPPGPGRHDDVGHGPAGNGQRPGHGQ